MNNNLSPTKRTLLEQWLQGQLNGHLASIPPRPTNSPIPISFPQQRQLFLELLHHGTAVNNLSVFLELEGELDIRVLEESANRIIARHDILRTRFSFDKGLPIPEVLPHAVISLSVIDLGQVNYANQSMQARAIAERDVLQPFNLTQAPLIRLKLYVLNEERHLLLATVHHTISDGWSLGVFLTELMSFYQGIINGNSHPLTPLPIQYADFAHWQTSEKLESVMQSSLPYWKKQLGGELPALELPTDHPRDTGQSYSGGTHRFLISKDLTQALEKLSSESDATLFMTLLAAYYILLHRYSGQDEILVGSPIANRSHPDLQHMIGVFINTLALRVNLSDNPTFLELLKQVRSVCLEAYAHQDLPFEKVVEKLKPQRDLSRPPIFQVVFNLQNSPMPELKIPGLKMKFLELDRGVSEFDFTLMISKLNGECHATVEFSNDLFQAATITRMFQSYLRLLEDVVAHPYHTTSRLQIISKEEQHRLIHELNQTQLDFPREKCLHELFEAQVECTPDAPAVIHANSSITYLELNRRANRLASHLTKLGVGPGTRVGIFMERSLEIVEVLLGVLKAGGIYVPINTSFPAERIQFILHDASISVLLTNIKLELLGDHNVHVVNVNDDTYVATESFTPRVEATTRTLAYIMYTSGSTGNPKGVMVQHSSLVNFLWSMRQRPGIRQNDVLMSVTAISFDIAALELFLPLIVGATVMIAGKEITSNPAMIDEAIRDYHVNMMQATPATWRLLIEAGWSGAPGLKALCGGETLTRKLADQLLDRVGSLWNMYGPTETTVWSSVNQIQKGENAITIGQPIGNTQLYVLDRELTPVPAGVVGELHIAGEGLAKGYLNLNCLTSEKFISHSLNSGGEERLYKTGDRARYLIDGSIEILGRMDDQVKINGHRIEPVEITTVLLQHASVQEAIVISQNGSAAEWRLVAYIVWKHHLSVEVTELREFLARKLPAYMIPSFFVTMSSLPTTLHGKIDRHALPSPGDFQRPSGIIAPRNEEENVLAEIWRNVLHKEQLSVYDNFFDLGGASMQSLQIIARANMYGLKISVEDIFKHQTIAELAASMKGLHKSE